MNQDRLRTWLRKRPPGSTHVQLVIEQPSGVGTVVGTWEQEAIAAALEPASGEQDPSEAILETAQDYTDQEGEPLRFLIRWMAGEKPKLTTPHQCKPTAAAAARTAAELAREVDPLVMVKQLLDANLKMVQQVTNSVGTVCQSFERVLQAQNVQIELQNARAALEVGAREVTDEEREMNLQRAGAWNALAQLLKEKAPDVVDGVVAIAVERLSPDSSKETRQ